MTMQCAASPTAPERASSDTASSDAGGGAVSLYPRRKHGGCPPAKHRTPVTLDYETLESLFDMPQPDAARELGIALTTLKHACRRLGVTRWPYSRKRATPSARGLASASSQRSASSDCSTTESSTITALGSPYPDDVVDCKALDASHDDSSDVSVAKLSADSSPEVHSTENDPVMADPFALDALNEHVESSHIKKMELHHLQATRCTPTGAKPLPRGGQALFSWQDNIPRSRPDGVWQLHGAWLVPGEELGDEPEFDMVLSRLATVPMT
jgi:hypothetical protein